MSLPLPRHLSAKVLAGGFLLGLAAVAPWAQAQEFSAAGQEPAILSGRPAPSDGAVAPQTSPPPFPPEEAILLVPDRGSFLRYRALDFADIFTGRVSGAREGRAAGFYLQATWLAQLGLVYFNGEHAGSQGRAAGVWRERRIQGGVGPAAYTHIDMKTVQGNGYAFEAGPWGRARERGVVRNGEFLVSDGRTDPLALGLEIQPGFLPGFELRFAPLELVDFILGFARIDIYYDDLPSADMETEEENGAVVESGSSEDAEGSAAEESVQALSSKEYAPGADASPDTPTRVIEPGSAEQTRMELRIPNVPGASDEAERTERIKADGDLLITHRLRLSVEEPPRRKSGFFSRLKRIFRRGGDEPESVVIQVEPVTPAVEMMTPDAAAPVDSAPRSEPLPAPSELGSTEDVGN